MPIVTLSKSMSSAAFGAWWVPCDCAGDIAWGPRWIGFIACGPRWTGGLGRCPPEEWDGDRCCRVLIFWELPKCEAASLRYQSPCGLHAIESSLRQSPQAVPLPAHPD